MHRGTVVILGLLLAGLGIYFWGIRPKLMLLKPAAFPLQKGSSGIEVARLQTALNKYISVDGSIYTYLQPLKVNGKFDEATADRLALLFRISELPIENYKKLMASLPA
jgi:hypothetical protein